MHLTHQLHWHNRGSDDLSILLGAFYSRRFRACRPTGELVWSVRRIYHSDINSLINLSASCNLKGQALLNSVLGIT